jgi:hypothetical protein
LFLILDQQLTEFSLWLRNVAERKGLNTLLLTSAEVVRNQALVFHLSEQDISFQLRFQETVIETRDIEGVYCGINTFNPGLWTYFTAEDAEYAARETQALWLTILSSLPCRVVNPPALDTLAGTLLDTPEILYLAHQIGFQIPTMITLESGEVAAEMLSAGIPALYTDLGEVWINETSSNQVELSILAQNRDNIRVTEEVPGKPFYVTLLGNQFLACTPEAGGVVRSVSAHQIPRLIKSRLRTLQKHLNLNLAEYYFRITTDGIWVFSGYWRPPSFSVAAYGDDLLAQIVDYAVKKRG